MGGIEVCGCRIYNVLTVFIVLNDAKLAEGGGQCRNSGIVTNMALKGNSVL